MPVWRDLRHGSTPLLQNPSAQRNRLRLSRADIRKMTRRGATRL